MKLFFLSANERLDGGLLQSQMIRPVKAHFGLLATVINLHRPFSKGATCEGIETINIPCLIPFRFVNFKLFFFLNEFLCLLYSLLILLKTYFKHPKMTIVCRGYVPGLIGWWLNFLFGIQYIFDPRSLYVHEQMGSGRVKPGSIIQLYWFWLERRVIRSAMRTVCVSKGMADYYEGICSHRKGSMIIIPCFATSSRVLDFDERVILRRKLGFSEDDIVIAYYGSVNNGWNNFKIYLNFFLAAGMAGAKVLIISQDALALRQSELGSMSFIKITGGEGLSLDEGQALLSIADYGVVLMSEVPDWRTRLSVKFAEYTSTGLPVIVGKFVGEAARLVRENNLEPSIILDEFILNSSLKKPTDAERNRIRKWASEYFSNKNILKILNG